MTHPVPARSGVAGHVLSLPAYRLASFLVRSLPAPVTAAAVRPLGVGLTMALPARRRLVERHLQRVHGPDSASDGLQAEVRRAFESYARYWIESFRLPALSKAEIRAQMWAEGLEHLDAALAGGKGVILALPHLGGWDFGGAWLAIRGHPLTVVVEPVQPPELLEWFTALRSDVGLTVVPLGPDAGSAVLRALRANRVVALLSDRHVGGSGVEVEFFGERTTLPAGPVTLALRAGAAVLPTAVYFDGPHGHMGLIRPPLALNRSGSFRDDVARLTADLARELELLIRRAPSQWHLFQPNWPSDHD
ncbi:MAG: phosphatidylinositol mannoside acyltransferase [Actinobacteria bacterium]|nr:phosphatidylinositol mannoside acyltransferase [Actinomycetota bacterium]